MNDMLKFFSCVLLASIVVLLFGTINGCFQWVFVVDGKEHAFAMHEKRSK